MGTKLRLRVWKRYLFPVSSSFRNDLIKSLPAERERGLYFERREENRNKEGRSLVTILLLLLQGAANGSRKDERSLLKMKEKERT